MTTRQTRGIKLGNIFAVNYILRAPKFTTSRNQFSSTPTSARYKYYTILSTNKLTAHTHAHTCNARPVAMNSIPNVTRLVYAMAVVRAHADLCTIIHTGVLRLSIDGASPTHRYWNMSDALNFECRCAIPMATWAVEMREHAACRISIVLLERAPGKSPPSNVCADLIDHPAILVRLASFSCCGTCMRTIYGTRLRTDSICIEVCNFEKPSRIQFTVGQSRFVRQFFGVVVAFLVAKLLFVVKKRLR